MNLPRFGLESNRRISVPQPTSAVCLCLLVALLSTCTKNTEDIASADESKKTSVVVTTEITSIVAKTSIPKGNWDEIILPGGESLSAVQFTTATVGWVGSVAGSLYQTKDGGINWTRVELGNRPGNYLVSLSFTGDKLGWVVFSKYPSNHSDYGAYSTRILHTTDGGNNWRAQYEGPESSINQIRFNQNEGWATGVSYDSNKTSHLILHTMDYGEHWEDVSEEFERAVNSPSSHDFPVDIYSPQPYHARVLTVGGRVMGTEDGGRRWRDSGTIRDEFQQTGFMRIGGMGNGNVWTLGGADSKEGIWVNFSVLRNNESWTRYRTTQVFFRDAILLRDGRAVACGALPDYENPQKVTDKRAAVIAYSSDEGRNWSIVYKSDKARIMNALFVFGDRVWAVGKNGLIVHLQIPNR